jgi:uncharacterized membrane protein YczE
LAHHLGLAIGTVVIIVGAAVLILWIPLRQRPGLGTVSNVVLVGMSMNISLDWLPRGGPLAARIGEMTGGIGLCAIATGMYIGANFGPGPRDGLMTGLARVTGRSIRLTRTALEVTVLAIGWILGGTVGVGTVAFAVAIGPLVQIFLPLFDVRAVVDVVVVAGEPGGEAVDRDLEIGVGVDEDLEPVAEPLDADLLRPAPGDELLDPAVGEVHQASSPG